MKNFKFGFTNAHLRLKIDQEFLEAHGSKLLESSTSNNGMDLLSEGTSQSRADIEISKKDGEALYTFHLPKCYKSSQLTAEQCVDKLLQFAHANNAANYQTAPALNMAAISCHQQSVLVYSENSTHLRTALSYFKNHGFQVETESPVLFDQSGLSIDVVELIAANSKYPAKSLLVIDQTDDDVADCEPLSSGDSSFYLMSSCVNTEQLERFGLAAVAKLAKNMSGLKIRYKDVGQLDDFASYLAAYLNDDADSLFKLAAMRLGQHANTATQSDITEPSEIPEATQPKPHKKLCVGMATYDDFDGVYFSIQSLRMFQSEVLDDIEILVLDNNPSGPCGKALKALEHKIENYRYVPITERVGTGIRDLVFEHANADNVLCMDCHVVLESGVLAKLMDYFDQHPESIDLLQGPMLDDNLKGVSTHFKPEWGGGMYGRWGTDDRGLDPQGEPFEIEMQGLGLFACRKQSWPGFNPLFKGFGGEEGYIHEKIRQAGGQNLCLPFLRWLHRFPRPMGVPYPINWEDRIGNYLTGHLELGLNSVDMIEHFEELLGEPAVKKAIEMWQKLDPSHAAINPVKAK